MSFDTHPHEKYISYKFRKAVLYYKLNKIVGINKNLSNCGFYV